MKAIFTRTGVKRYSVTVEGPGVATATMDPAPGYDAKMPHDMAHFIVENELGLKGGVFGQLAAGGHAGTFRPIDEKRPGRKLRSGDRIAKENRADASLSELVVNLACRTWKKETELPDQIKGISKEDVQRICQSFDEISRKWSTLAVGESITLDWQPRNSARR